ncbi:hypothetical protein ABIB26_002813 [Arthrobacter sp. UYEF20]
MPPTCPGSAAGCTARGHFREFVGGHARSSRPGGHAARRGRRMGIFRFCPVPGARNGHVLPGSSPAPATGNAPRTAAVTFLPGCFGATRKPPAGIRGSPRQAGGRAGKQPGRSAPLTARVHVPGFRPGTSRCRRSRCGACPDPGARSVAPPGASGHFPGRTCPVVALGTGHIRTMSIGGPRRGAYPDPGARAVAPPGASGHFPGRTCPVFASGTGHIRTMSIGGPRRGACPVRWSFSLRSAAQPRRASTPQRRSPGGLHAQAAARAGRRQPGQALQGGGNRPRRGRRRRARPSHLEAS